MRQERCGDSRCIPWGRGFAAWCDAPIWTHFVAPERLDAMREFAWIVSKASNKSALYWITPKSAHTTIMRRLVPQQFHIVSVADASMHERRKRLLLDAALKKDPLEFTFVRSADTHVLSATRQLQFCARRLYRRDIDLLPILENITLNRWRYTKCEELHLYPQVSGYAFDARGINRLHFVGRVEEMSTDWNRLLSMLGHRTGRKGGIPRVNSRPPNNAEDYASFLVHPMVRAHTEWDYRCFHAD